MKGVEMKWICSSYGRNEERIPILDRKPQIKASKWFRYEDNVKIDLIWRALWNGYIWFRIETLTGCCRPSSGCGWRNCLQYVG